MFDIKKAYGFDKTKANQGVKHVFGPDAENDWVMICRLPNDNYSAELKKIFRANHEKMERLKSQGEAGEKAAAELDAKLHTEVIAKTIITDWGKGMADEGKSIKSTLENRVEILTKYPDFRSACVEFASDRLNFPMEEDVEKVKK